MADPTPYSQTPRLMPGWYRARPRRMPPELLVIFVVIGLSFGLCVLSALHRPFATATVADLAPACADSTRQPCKGRAQ